VTVLPVAIVAPIRKHPAKLHARFERQRRLGEPGVSLPTAVTRKYPNTHVTGKGAMGVKSPLDR
jgi:hypothetical protein